MATNLPATEPVNEQPVNEPVTDNPDSRHPIVAAFHDVIIELLHATPHISDDRKREIQSQLSDVVTKTPDEIKADQEKDKKRAELQRQLAELNS